MKANSAYNEFFKQKQVYLEKTQIRKYFSTIGLITGHSKHIIIPRPQHSTLIQKGISYISKITIIDLFDKILSIYSNKDKFINAIHEAYYGPLINNVLITVSAEEDVIAIYPEKQLADFGVEYLNSVLYIVTNLFHKPSTQDRIKAKLERIGQRLSVIDVIAILSNGDNMEPPKHAAFLRTFKVLKRFSILPLVTAPNVCVTLSYTNKKQELVTRSKVIPLLFSYLKVSALIKAYYDKLSAANRSTLEFAIPFIFIELLYPKTIAELEPAYVFTSMLFYLSVYMQLKVDERVQAEEE